MRQNLDPWNEFSDKQLWDSLAHVRLEGYVSRQSGGLDMELLEGGSNRTRVYSHLIKVLGFCAYDAYANAG